MTITKTGAFAWAGGGKNGAIVDMWAASRFATAPGLNSTTPDGNPPDAGPVTTGTSFGGPGAFRLTVPSVQDYYVRVQYGGAVYWSTCPAGSLSGGSGASNVIRIVSAPYTAISGDVVLVTTGASAIGIALPAPTAGSVVVMKKVDAGAGTASLVIPVGGTALIDGSSSLGTNVQYARFRVIADGTNWNVV